MSPGKYMFSKTRTLYCIYINRVHAALYFYKQSARYFQIMLEQSKRVKMDIQQKCNSLKFIRHVHIALALLMLWTGRS